MTMDKFSSGRKLVLLVPCVVGAKGKGNGGGRKARKRGKGKAVPVIRAGVFVLHPPLVFLNYSDNINCQCMTNHN